MAVEATGLLVSHIYLQPPGGSMPSSDNGYGVSSGLISMVLPLT